MPPAALRSKPPTCTSSLRGSTATTICCTELKAFALNCSLKGTDASESSSTDKLIEDIFAAMEKHGVTGEVERAADYNIKPGVLSDEGEGDEWAGLRSKLLAADIFILGTPIWLGQPSSVAKRVVERMDAFLSETDDAGRMPPAVMRRTSPIQRASTRTPNVVTAT